MRFSLKMIYSVVVSFLLASSAFSQSLKASWIVNEVLPTIQDENLRITLEEFSGVRPVQFKNRSVVIKERGSPEGRKLGALYILQRLGQMGLQAKLLPYTYTQMIFIKYTGNNVEAIVPGTNPNAGTIIISAHLDSVDNAGADDDGTGVAAALETARALLAVRAKGFQNQKTVRFVFFDQEEKGLIGSKAYVKELKASGIRNVTDFQMDMIGYSSTATGEMHVMDCDRGDSVGFGNLIKAVPQTYGLNLKLVPACTDRSDHASFWKAGYSGVAVGENFFGGDENVCYHKQCDRIDKINFRYFNDMTKLIVASFFHFTGLQKVAPAGQQRP